MPDNTYYPPQNMRITDPVTPANQAMVINKAVLVSSDGVKSTYRAVVVGATPVAAPTDFLVIQGVASATIRIKRVKIGGVATTAGQLIAQLIRRSTAGTPGSAVLTAITPIAQHDINDAAPAAAPKTVGTANYTTPGTSAGVLAVGRTFLNTAAAGPTNEIIWDFSTRQDKAVIIRGVSDYVWLNFNGAALPAGSAIDIDIEWEEDAS